MPSAFERPLCVVVSAWRVVAEADWHETTEPQHEGETMTTEKLTITMSERGPITILDEEWPIIAHTNSYYGECERERVVRHLQHIIVRAHADGRRIVYGWEDGGRSGGYLLPGGSPETVRAIRRVGGILGDNDLAWQCIGDLPAEEL